MYVYMSMYKCVDISIHDYSIRQQQYLQLYGDTDKCYVCNFFVHICSIRYTYSLILCVYMRYYTLILVLIKQARCLDHFIFRIFN